VKPFRTTALLATTAAALAIASAAGPASAAVNPSLVGPNPISAVASADGGSAVVTLRVVCPVSPTDLSALQVTVGAQSNIDGGHSMPGKLIRCTGKAQKVAVVVTPGLSMLGYPGAALVPGQDYPAKVSLSTHAPDRMEPLSVTSLADRTITVKG
jgi:hypothetical protein